jgi:hypothetical protein
MTLVLSPPSTDVRYLVRLSELGSPSVAIPALHLAALHRLTAWIRDFLCHPHAEVGRPGAVCPYTGPALDKDLLFFAAPAIPEPDDRTLERIALDLCRWFLEIEPRTGHAAQLKACLIILPELAEARAADLVERVQKKLLSDFVAEGLMIGQFYPQCNSGGLWNPAFRPLRSPIPLLGMRHMVATDVPFLRSDPRNFEVYLRLFGDRIPAPLEAMAKEAMAQLGLSVRPPIAI